MTLDVVRDFLGWCTLINLGVLVWWFLWLVLAKDWVYRMHRRWFDLSDAKLDAIHYGALACFKLTVFVFNLAPYLALRIIG